MIGYTTVGTNNLQRAEAFYNDLLALLGARVMFRTHRGVGWGAVGAHPMFSVMLPFDGSPATVGNGAMVALQADNEELVQRVHAKALELGGQDEGAPGSRNGSFYGAYFRDLDGNKLAIYCMTGSN